VGVMVLFTLLRAQRHKQELMSLRTERHSPVLTGVSHSVLITAVREIAALAALARNDMGLLMSFRAQRHKQELMSYRAKRGISLSACTSAVREIAALAALARNDMGLLMSLRAERHSLVLAGVTPSRLRNCQAGDCRARSARSQ